LLTIDASVGWTEADQEIYEQVQHRPLILVINKIDLVEEAAREALSTNIQVALEAHQRYYPKSTIHTAAAQNQGIEELETAILEAVHMGNLTAANLDVAINQRQAAALTQAKTSLQQVQETIAQQLPLDFWSIDLRGAIQVLGEITGEEVTESVLDRIFSRFCIGK
jgi:tRNA modification GTPase